LWPSSLRAECPVTATGLCTPGVEATIVEDIIETTEHGSDGYTVITETTTTTTTVTTTNEDSGDLLDGNNDYVSSSKYEGDMDVDWGGQGPATMPSGNSCYGLGADKCAQITGSGNSTSTMGVPGMGTTFINTIDISELDIENGGRTNYTIKIDKQDAQDRIYMHVTGRNGNTNVFSGTDILSESGVTTGFAEYAGGWDFSGSITTIIVEVGGRDINLAIGPLFDDVSINVLYNVINTIVNETITTVEMWVSMGGSIDTEVIDIVENIFEHNDIVVDGPGDDMYFEPEFEEPNMEMSYETVEMEMEMDFDFEIDFEMPDVNMDEMEVAVMDIEMEMEMEMPEMEMSEPEMEPEPMNEPEMEPESKPEMEEVKDEPIEEPTEEPQEDVAEEPENEESVSETKADEEPEDKGEADKSEDDEKPVKKQEQKEKAAKKIVKKMGDKGRYDSTNQTKTLIVMQVLGDTKTFFDTQQQLEDRVGFFTDMIIPDTKIEDNNMAGYFLFVGSDGLMNQIEESQWQN
jgi:flagellar biosynthesis GTPase FlhF